MKKHATSSYLRQHRVSMMPLPAAVPERLREPGRDGYRTPMIEDPEHPLNMWDRAQRQSADQPVSRSFIGLQNDQLTPRQNAGVRMVKTTGSDETDDHGRPRHLTWKERTKHITWAYFTVTMATGGIANVISAVPYRFDGLRVIGLIFFLLNIVLYIVIWAMILTRFTMYPYTFKASFTHPTESLFVPAVAVSFGTILINIVEYGFGEVGLWLNKAVLVLFWFDAALAVVLSVGIYMILWSTQSFTIAQMTPIWIFPAYPLLIIGPHAANLSARLRHPSQSLPVIIGGFTIQGIGFLVSLTIYSAFVYRLMTQKLPSEPLRPGMFVSVGPSAFTVSGVIGMAASLPKALSNRETYMGIDAVLTGNILKIVANWASLWLWGLALWFFFVSVVSNLAVFRPHHQVPFSMTWFSFIFPQTALTTATLKIGDAFETSAIKWLGCVMACLLVAVWLAVVTMMIRAVVKKQILWPEKGEDREEGGFVGEIDEKSRKRDVMRGMGGDGVSQV